MITKYSIALLGIVLVGAFLRVYQLAAQSIWLDEAGTVSMAALSILQIAPATAPAVHPPLYYWILHYWIQVFGTSESAVRLLSALFGVLAIPVIYAVGRQLFSKETGYLSVARYSVLEFDYIMSFIFEDQVFHRETLGLQPGNNIRSFSLDDPRVISSLNHEH